MIPLKESSLPLAIFPSVPQIHDTRLYAWVYNKRVGIAQRNREAENDGTCRSN